MNFTDRNISVHGTDNSFQETAIYFSILLVWFPGIILNSIALCFIIKDIRKAVFPPVVLLFLLCLHDLLAVLFSLTQHLLDEFVQMADTLCSASTFFFSYFTIAAGVLNSLMAIDRVMAICTPFFYKRKIDVKTWKNVCIAAGLMTALYSLFPMIGLGDIWTLAENGKKRCNLGYQDKAVKRVYGMIYGALGFIFIAFIVVCNSVLARALFKMKKTVVSLQSSSVSDTPSGNSTENTRGSSFEKAFAKLMISLSIAYIVCGTPTKVYI